MDLYEQAPVGYLSIHTDGLIIQVNETLASWSGYAKTDLLGRRFASLLTVGTRIFYETNVAPLLRMQGGFSEMALELRTADGHVLPVFAHAQLQQNDTDRLPIIRLALTKALDRRRYEQELLEARAAAKVAEARTQTLLESEREIAQLREEFIAVLGHDLRNPLASIGGGLNLLKRDVTPERRALILDMLEGSVFRMGTLIDNVLDFARGRLGAGIPLDLRIDVALTPILEQVVSELRLGNSGRAIETDFDLPAPIRCDPSRIGQLVSNLLGNALTHGEAGQPVQVHADQSDGVLTIWIANAGEPIPPQAMERLFHPFFRGEVRSSLQGLGLGLHIASEIAKAHGGTLGVDSTHEATRFTFRMPLLA
ncbi:HAMP domain-containing sensor histidine kinase [Lichenihabitans sp. Uapishka_5]|uniref:PAS domain-containing sensor histidine kinase n=1 Tax=Lichenihabitans sp. Uapishka_5 TaxID=3037302 RepID=UPI0029E8175A|nr:HAMP domain-containing sensor histidine kinase [Lichenihabitans sp. Uapishka_5]MDX7951771.1 HAMP domain-containing sensor histidine kinase [Lichenihabitans sp. Uapishka_5]